MRRTLRIATLVFLAAALWPASRAGAVTDEEVFRNFRFNFVNPGGRALAMGGAFVGIADDATAAAANPAGLTNLLSPEFFIEGRLSDTSTSVLSSAIDDPRGLPDQVRTDSIGDPENVLHPSFISYVHPFENWVFAFSRQEILNVDIDTENVFSDAPIFPTTEIVRANGESEAQIAYYNLSLGFRGGEKFAAGVTLTYAAMDLESRTDNFFLHPTRGLEPDYATVVNDSDDDYVFSVGLLFKPYEKFHIGAVYRQGPEFDLLQTIEDSRPSGSAAPLYPSAQVLADFLGNRNYAFDPGSPFGISPSTFDDPLSFNNFFHVPDQYAIGFGWRATESFTVALDVVHIEYSDLEDNFIGNVNALTFPGDVPVCDASKPNMDGSIPCDYTTPTATYEFDDQTIWRLGLEYLWTIKEKIPFALRAGIYVDPNVRLEADFPADGVFIANDETFPEGKDETHYTFGFGLVLQDKFQIDVAADFANDDSTYISSFIYHF